MLTSLQKFIMKCNIVQYKVVPRHTAEYGIWISKFLEFVKG